jgi:hypothetical protein
MALLIFQSFSVEYTAVTTMLERIQEMKNFHGTAFKDSKELAGSTIKAKTQKVWAKGMALHRQDGAISVS